MNNLLGKIDQLLRSEPLPENLPRLFETLHWGLPEGMTERQLSVGAPVNTALTVHPVAQLSGLPVFRMDWPEDHLPGTTARRAVQRALKPVHAEHLICYVTQDKKQAAFVWARARADGKTELRTLPYEVGSPARTTIEQLAKLAFSLEELGSTGQPLITAVTDKLNAAFSVEAVTKRFYQEIANWYFWAREHVVFPMPETETNREAYISQSLIRLITRLIFCWFVKQMGLIPGELFDPAVLSKLLKDFDPQGGADNLVCAPSQRSAGNPACETSSKSSGQTRMSAPRCTFYKAILQNLFFATLNQEIGKRQFRKRHKDPHGRDPHHGITNLYRYEDLFTDTKAFLRLVERIPFLNGGLFECLDQVYRADEHRTDVRIDGFSDHPKNPLSVPDYLFFGDERTVDLSKAYGEAKYKRATVRGLIHIFNRYNFTVTESTPLDQEVALDPELAGKVFENLLASYNPETATTARKATGSYYTPREIVDYMVDEALIAYLKTQVEQTLLSAAKSSTSNPACVSEQTGLSALPRGAGNPACDPEQNRFSALPSVQPFNPEAEVHKTHRRLPHWTQEGRTYFVTFRLADSLPKEKLRQWLEERDIWLKHHPEPWSDRDWAEYDERFGQRFESWLDAGEGACHLRRPEIRALVESCLRHFDGQRYDLAAYVVMPNHVHLLISPREGFALADILKGVKGVSAREANKRLGRQGTFWQEESFDHIVRSQVQFERFLRYIADNPVKARLHEGEYSLFQRGADNPVREDEQTQLSALLESRLRHLLAYNDEPHQFSPAEVQTLITAIDNLKALDPACGSGAFPMGMLHKLVHILRKLDSRNEQWKQRQIARVREAMAAAEKIEDATIRERTLKDLEHQIASIEDAFARGELDYGRKLYLIENCIYGVDIQPIAVQIAKMRFFISLTVDQKIDPNAPNLGVRPLPNLETKFVTANTLIGIERPAQAILRNPQIDAKEAELRQVRERHFTARTPATKARLRELDAKIRAEISQLLRADGFPRETTEKLANWNPYDQNASADFFDPEWMFGLTRPFDIVIGNPPYGAVIPTGETQRIARRIRDTENSNRAAIFIDIGKNILIHQHGVLSFVVPKSLLYSERWFPLANTLAPNTSSLVDLEQAFENVLLEQVVFVFRRSQSVSRYQAFKFRGTEFIKRAVVPVSCVSRFHTWPCDVDDVELQLGIKISNSGMFLRDVTKSFRGFGLQHKLAQTGKYRVIGGKNILRYGISGHKGFVRQADLDSAAKKASMLLQPKVISQQIVAHIQNPKPHIMIIASVDHAGDVLGLDTVENTVPVNEAIHLNMIAALFNSSLINWYTYRFIYCAAVRTMHFDDHYIGKIPLPPDYRNKQQPIIALVDKILAAKRADPNADTSALEREIDQHVYQLYGLTPEEIRIVEEGAR